MRIPQLTLCALFAAMLAGPALADKDGHDKGGNNECPVGLLAPDYQTLNQEFGPDTSDLTRCIKKRHQVKMVVQLNQGNGYGLNNIQNIIYDYEITHDMERGRDYEIVAVIHSGGGKMALTDEGLDGAGQVVKGRNPSEGMIKKLMAQGVKFYFCQNTTRSYLGQGILPKVGAKGSATEGGATAELIEGMQYTTAGLTSIADFEALGYQYIQP